MHNKYRSFEQGWSIKAPAAIRYVAGLQKPYSFTNRRSLVGAGVGGRRLD